MNKQNMNSKEDIKGTELLDMLEQSDNPALSDFEALLSDERSAEDARLILEYRLAKFDSNASMPSSCFGNCVKTNATNTTAATEATA